jgi:hypothetical protein
MVFEGVVLENDSYKGEKWDCFYDEFALSKNRKRFAYSVLLRRYGAPKVVVRFLNERFGKEPAPYDTVVCDLKSFKPNKKVRYALRRFPVDEVRQIRDYDAAERFVNEYRKDIGLPPVLKDNIRMVNEYGCGKTYAAFKSNCIVGCLSIAEGKEWITELIAAGLQDAIKVKIIEDYRKTHDYYDLAGYDGSERARFKKKWGALRKVKLVH